MNAQEIGPYKGDKQYLNAPTSIREIFEWSEKSENKPIAILLGGGVINPLVEQGKTELIPEWLELIRKEGFLAGVGSHYHNVIDICEDKGYNPDFYMITFNGLAITCSKDTEAISKSIRSTNKPVLAFKVLGGGRIPPRDAFRFTLKSIKSTDFLNVGMAFPEEVEENTQLIRELTSS